MFPGAIFSLVLLAVLVSIAFSVQQSDRRRTAWSEASRALGLNYRDGGGPVTAKPIIQGQLRGVSVLIDVNTRGSGDDKKHYTRYRLGFPGEQTAPVTLRKQGALSFLGALVGRRDVTIGDPAFDDRVVIDSPDAEATARYLTPTRRMAALSVFESWDKAEITPQMILVERRGITGDAQQIVNATTRLLDIALTFSAPAAIDRALEQQASGDLADAARTLREINDVQDEPANSFTQLLEAEALVAMGDGAAAAEVLDAIADDHDPELDAWREVARSHPEPVVLATVTPPDMTAEVLSGAVPPTAVPPTQITPVAPLDQQSVITDLFASNRLGFEVETRFFEAYEGATIEWTGTVERMRPFRSDGDFPGSGVKATVNIGSLGDGRLVSDQIHAIVHLPDGTDLGRDATITFRGSFVRVDRYMRNLFVANAAVR